MGVHTFYNPELVEQLNASGITARARPDARGFVIGRRGPARAQEAVTNVVAVQGNVTITATRQVVERPLLATRAPEPQIALELVEECTRLRRDNQRLTDEVARLRGELAKVSSPPVHENDDDHDDTKKRFALLELD